MSLKAVAIVFLLVFAYSAVAIASVMPAIAVSVSAKGTYDSLTVFGGWVQPCDPVGGGPGGGGDN